MDTVTILALLTGLLLVVLVVLGLTNRVLLRLSLRNTLRWPGQTLLLLCGLALAAALITASYGLTDSLNDTARLAQIEQVGNLDESVLGNFKQPQLDRSLAAIRANPNVQAATALVQSASVATIPSPRTGFTSSVFGIVAVPADFGRVFGSVTDKDGKAVTLADLSAGQIDVSATLAESFEVQPGDTLTVSFSGQQFTATVRSILSIDIATSDFDSGSQPELVMPLSFYQHLTHTEGSASTIVIKNIGQDGMDDTGPKNSRRQAVAQFLRHLFGIQERSSGSSESYTAGRGTGTHLTIIKPDLVSAADSSSFFAASARRTTNSLANCCQR
jgi:putative ABC transport system permease protein